MGADVQDDDAELASQSVDIATAQAQLQTAKEK